MARPDDLCTGFVPAALVSRALARFLAFRDMLNYSCTQWELSHDYLGSLG